MGDRTAFNQQELDQFAYFAARFQSDGEAMCLAIAEERQWIVATDDRKAIRVAQQAGLTVVRCPELVKRWATATGADQAALNKVLRDIQFLARFKPYRSLPHSKWWIDELAKASP
jgi:predicted nucleic acid-binding protein